MKTKGRNSIPSADVINLSKMSPDERQTAQNDQYASGILGSIHAQDAATTPMPRPDPRDKMKPGLGGGQTYGQFDQMLAEEGAVNRYSEDLARADYLRWPLGYNDSEDYAKKHGQQYHQAAEFLLDTFKRARTVGYPIHPLVPYLTNQLPMTAFEGQAGK